MKEVRCEGILKNGRKCNKLLMKIEEGALYEIQCPDSRCKHMNTSRTPRESAK